MVSSMNKTYTDADLKRILGSDRKKSEIIDRKMQEAYREIRLKGKEHERMRNSGWHTIGMGRIWKKAAGGFGAAAVVFLLAIVFCTANPSLAAELPVVGSIFAKVQEIFPFGRIPEENITFLQEDGKAGTDNDVPYSDNAKAFDQGITFTLTEYYASNQAVFLGVRVENEEFFPELVYLNEPDKFQLLQLTTTETYSFRAEGNKVVYGARDLEGRLLDDHTFEGIIRIDYDSIRADDRKYIAACEEAEAKGEPLPAINAENYDFYVNEYKIPDSFQMQFQINSFWGYTVQEDGEGGERYRMKGEWVIPDILKIQQSTQGSDTIWINEVNEEGIGLEYIEISPIELTLHPFENAGGLCIAVAFDKDGRWMESGSTNFYELATTGHDISAITVYICDYDEYMDELKGIVIKQGDAAFQAVLEERALYKKTIETMQE